MHGRLYMGLLKGIILNTHGCAMDNRSVQKRGSEVSNLRKLFLKKSVHLKNFIFDRSALEHYEHLS